MKSPSVPLEEALAIAASSAAENYSSDREPIGETGEYLCETWGRWIAELPPRWQAAFDKVNPVRLRRMDDEAVIEALRRHLGGV